MCMKFEEPRESDFVELDPSGRFGRYDEVLGKGSSKTVYRAFDELEGIEVAWNQVKLQDFLNCPEELERLCDEIHFLKTLDHQNIMMFYSSWVDIPNRKINFITELFTSGTLKQYRRKHNRVNLRAIKHWCRQILRGLLYLHSHKPPIIHRDLKCDNIFINGNHGEVKIGDLGLAVILRKSQARHCVGTPEFMAPEVYEEKYNELVDIYSFGMCILEMVTGEYPYSECTYPAHIYKKVISGTNPEALYRVENPDIKFFIEKCLSPASKRPSASELLMDPFLKDVSLGSADLGTRRIKQLRRLLGFRRLHIHDFSLENEEEEEEEEEEEDGDYSSNSKYFEANRTDLFDGRDEEPINNVGVAIEGRMREDGCIFIRLRIFDSRGRGRVICFPFDIKVDTAISVTSEMIAELDIKDHDVKRIAEMIDGEISSLVPNWKPGTKTPTFISVESPSSAIFCSGKSLRYGYEGSDFHSHFGEISNIIGESDRCLTDEEIVGLSSRPLEEEEKSSCDLENSSSDGDFHSQFGEISNRIGEPDRCSTHEEIVGLSSRPLEEQEKSSCDLENSSSDGDLHSKFGEISNRIGESDRCSTNEEIFGLSSRSLEELEKSLCDLENGSSDGEKRNVDRANLNMDEKVEERRSMFDAIKQELLSLKANYKLEVWNLLRNQAICSKNMQNSFDGKPRKKDSTSCLEEKNRKPRKFFPEKFSVLVFWKNGGGGGCKTDFSAMEERMSTSDSPFGDLISNSFWQKRSSLL